MGVVVYFTLTFGFTGTVSVCFYVEFSFFSIRPRDFL